MSEDEKAEFFERISAIYKYHRVSISAPLLEIFWNGCRRWSLEEIDQALTAVTNDPELGKFPPKIADLAFVLEGTTGSKAAIAWGKAHEAMSSVGAYTPLAFDDPVIHAVVEDMGGWPKMCRTELRELGMLQTRFQKSYQAYVNRKDLVYPRVLGADAGPDNAAMLADRGLRQKIALVGDPAKAKQVVEGGQAGGKLAVTMVAPLALAAAKRLK